MTKYQFYDLPMEWQGFLQACNSCTNCELYKERKQVVVFRGGIKASFMIIGEGPGRQEDEQGLPFVGRSGHLLTDALTAREFTEEDYHICNIVKCRPPGNRTPTEDEAVACRRLLNAQFALVKPKIIMLSGATAFRYFTGSADPISKVRGVWIESKGYYIMPTFHPAYILRNMSKRDLLWHDLLMVRKKLEEFKLIAPMENPILL